MPKLITLTLSGGDPSLTVAETKTRLDGPLTVEAGQQNRWRLTVAANGEASLERLSVAL